MYNTGFVQQTGCAVKRYNFTFYLSALRKRGRYPTFERLLVTMKQLRFCLILWIAFTGVATKALAQSGVKKDSCVTGNCKNGNGTLRYVGGNEYSGDFKDGLPHGNGVMKYASGAKYEGAFDKGQKHGRGVYTYKSGNRYEGDYIQNRIEGQGTFYFTNGDRYEGHFVNGDFDGEGTFRYTSGNKYTGTWTKNKKNGQGTLTFPNGSKYSGAFRDDKFNGQGTYFFRDGSRYTGDFVNGDKHGRGVYVFRDSSQYEGEFVTDAIQGTGVSRYANGDRYEGQYVNGMYEGKGTYYYATGDKYEGTFKNNLMEGSGIYTAADGSSNKVTYRRGVLLKESANLQQLNDTLDIEQAPATQQVDTMQSRTKIKSDSTSVAVNNPVKAVDTTAVTHQGVPDTSSLVTETKQSQVPIQDTTTLASNVKPETADVKKKSEPVEPTAATAAKAEPAVLKCSACKGTGKQYQQAIVKKRVVTKDISNGVGPKNYVTYTIDDTVRPACYAVCSVCHGSGRKS
jgi:hypothetical protein